jgi:hypothetical protein
MKSMYMEMPRTAGATAGLTAHSVQKRPVTAEKDSNSKSLKDVAFSHQSGFFTTYGGGCLEAVLHSCSNQCGFKLDLIVQRVKTHTAGSVRSNGIEHGTFG